MSRQLVAVARPRLTRCRFSWRLLRWSRREVHCHQLAILPQLVRPPRPPRSTNRDSLIGGLTTASGAGEWPEAMRSVAQTAARRVVWSATQRRARTSSATQFRQTDFTLPVACGSLPSLTPPARWPAARVRMSARQRGRRTGGGAIERRFSKTRRAPNGSAAAAIIVVRPLVRPLLMRALNVGSITCDKAG